MKTFRITEQNYIKANRKASRELEIAMYGRPLPKNKIHKSGKIYNRRKLKSKLLNLQEEQ